MLTGGSRGQSHFAMQRVGSRDGYRLDLRIADELFVVAIDTCNLKTVCERLCVSGGGGSHGLHRHIGWDHADGGGVTFGLELGTDDADAYRTIFHIDLSLSR